jgi:hypothetical protein
MGCAIGLVGINSGGTNRWTDEAKNVVKILADASPCKRESTYIGDLISAESLVVNTNDGHCKTPAAAREWFSDALNLAKERQADSVENAGD